MPIVFIIFPTILFFVLATVIIFAVARGVRSRQSAARMAAFARKESDSVADSGEYRVKTADCDVHTHIGNKAVAADGHAHFGEEEERYDKIVGSLGEVEDEGCFDLDGIRLIAHDEAYRGEEEKRNYDEIVKAMILGEVISKPRFKNRSGKR